MTLRRKTLISNKHIYHYVPLSAHARVGVYPCISVCLDVAQGLSTKHTNNITHKKGVCLSMTREEFKERLEKIPSKYHAFSADDYAVIEYVYTWHPAIDNMTGKQQIAELYAHGGMMIMRDMYARSQKAEEADRKIRAIRADISGMEKMIAEIQAEVWA